MNHENQEGGVIDAMIARFESKARTRILAFGSSNTERRLFGMHWLDVLELALKRKYGRFHHCINAGRGGDTCDALLERYEEDAAFYRPHLAIITVGANDAAREVPYERVRANYRELHRRFCDLGTAVVFQTYYSLDLSRAKGMSRFFPNMEIMREVASETGAGLVDHLRRWEMLRTAHPQEYLPLMDDAMHVNWRGNLLMGAELADAFGVGDGLPDSGEWSETRKLQALIDAVEGKSQGVKAGA